MPAWASEGIQGNSKTEPDQSTKVINFAQVINLAQVINVTIYATH